jgi:GNAT superfamily N-acetyltransferase
MYTEKLNLEFKLLNKDTFDEQCYVHSMVFGDKDGDVETYWQKKHYDNPLGISLIFGVYFNKKLVGINSFQPCTYEVNGKILKIFQSSDSGVLPEYQGKGIWGNLMNFAENYIRTNTDCDVLIGFPNYRNSYPGFRKMTWETVFVLNNYLLVNNSQTFLQTIIPNKKGLQPIFSCVLNFQKGFVKCFKTKSVTLEPISNNMLIWNKNNNEFSVKFSNECLEWKLDYKQLSCLGVRDKNNNLLATCIYGISKYKGQKIVYINRLEFSHNNNLSEKVVLASLSDYLLKTYPDTAFVRVWVKPNDKYNKLFKNLLFLKTKHSNPFIIKKVSDKKMDYDWNVSFLDLD